MGLFRSQKMGYYNIIFPRTYAWEVMNQLGDISCLDFIDQSEQDSSFHKPYSTYVKRCEDLENKIKNIKLEMIKFGKEIKLCENYKEFIEIQNEKINRREKAGHTYFEEIEDVLNEKLNLINEQIKIYDDLIDKYNHLLEYKQVLILTRPHIGDRDFRAQNAGLHDEEEKVDYIESKNVKFSYLSGVIDQADSQRFKRILFRITRGMTYTILIDIDKIDKEDRIDENEESIVLQEHKDIATHEKTKKKTIFLIIYQGGSFDVLKGKLNKICDSFGALRYGIPEDKISLARKLQEVSQQLREAKNIIFTTKYGINRLLQEYCEIIEPFPGYPSHIEEIRLYVVKEKAIYHNLNIIRIHDQMLYGYCWCPIEFEEKVRNELQKLYGQQKNIVGIEFNLNIPPKDLKPPTYFKLNEFTWAFQEIVNTYGMPRYQEVNPGLFTIATFPFLFGVMFGDMGHGGILFLFGIYLVLKAEEIKKSKGLMPLLLPARYLILLMGFFALYCGFIYNDFLSIPFNLFGSCYNFSVNIPANTMLAKDNDCTYPAGIDPAWYGVQNELTFLNSLKMKLSVIIGVIQMTFGIFLKSLNAVHFSQPLDFFFDFLPQIIFMLCTFVYMDVLIFIKWATPWGTPAHPISEAPSIITTMINIPLKLGSTEGAGDLYDQQSQVQKILLIIAVLSIPVMLFVKPIILLIQDKRKKDYGSGAKKSEEDEILVERLMHANHEEFKDNNTHPDEIPEHKIQLEIMNEKPPVSSSSSSEKNTGSHHNKFEFGEVFVHQVIETIEFVLGSISNTASYLRLWALSLAHGQLATVFFSNTIGSAMTSGSILGVFIGYLVFANITFGVLMCMDVMECFLHALRLHWVEFQNKFYKADGHGFKPFSFENTLKQSNN